MWLNSFTNLWTNSCRNKDPKPAQSEPYGSFKNMGGALYKMVSFLSPSLLRPQRGLQLPLIYDLHFNAGSEPAEKGEEEGGRGERGTTAYV